MTDLVQTLKAGFWVRVVATVIDAVLIGILSSVLTATFGQLIGVSLSVILTVVYLIGVWVTTGQTVGHKILGLRVVRTDGGPLTLANAVLRYLGAFVSGVVSGIGFIWVAFDSNKQ